MFRIKQNTKIKKLKNFIKIFNFLYMKINSKILFHTLIKIERNTR